MTLSSLELSDAKVYASEIRALLGTRRNVDKGTLAKRSRRNVARRNHCFATNPFHCRREGFVEFVDFDLIGRIIGVSPCHPQARIEVAVLTRTYEQKTERRERETFKRMYINR